VVKRVFEIGAAAALLLAIAPLLAFVYVLVRLDGGPAIHRHRQIGRGGCSFDRLKFRTMRNDAVAARDAFLSVDAERAAGWRDRAEPTDDPRVTPLGRMLRESNLDELPQLVNVLRGEMSLFG
jgi:undecaprenyl-phosphate galactose phosphotransferase